MRAPHLVIALHGYAATGEPMAHTLAAGTPGDAEVIVEAPDGPHEAQLSMRGRSWFPITSQRTAMGLRAGRPGALVANRVADLRERHGVGRSRTCLIGFSQGVAVAVAALAHAPLCERAVLICGRVPSANEIAPDGNSPPVDVLVITGERDRYVPHDTVSADLRTSFLAASARCLVVARLGHELNEEVARLAMAHATNGVKGDQ